MASKRTRLVSQDMKTGEFAYADQLIKDGYYPNLMVLPKNYDPPQPVGQSMRLPLELLFNPAPENIVDPTVLVLAQQIDQNTGQAVLLPTSTGSVGKFTFAIHEGITGVSSVGSVNIGTSVSNGITGVSSTGSVGTLTFSIQESISGVSSQGSLGMPTVSSMNGVVTLNITGVSSTGSVAQLVPGSGWGEGGGWSNSTWSHT